MKIKILVLAFLLCASTGVVANAQTPVIYRQVCVDPVYGVYLCPIAQQTTVVQVTVTTGPTSVQPQVVTATQYVDPPAVGRLYPNGLPPGYGVDPPAYGREREVYKETRRVNRHTIDGGFYGRRPWVTYHGEFGGETITIESTPGWGYGPRVQLGDYYYDYDRSYYGRGREYQVFRLRRAPWQR